MEDLTWDQSINPINQSIKAYRGSIDHLIHQNN